MSFSAVADRLWYRRLRTYIVENGSPAFHRDTLEHGEHRIDDVIEADDAVFRSLPLWLTRRIIGTRVAATKRCRVLGARMFVLVVTEI